MSLVFARIAVLLAVVAVGVFADGGYSQGARLAFGLVAVGALAAVGRGGVVRTPVVAVLLALSAAGALSALWTLGPPDRTLRWALVTLGYACLVVIASAVARRPRGVEALALGLALFAFVAGVAGLIAAAAHSTPYAGRIAGVWRPGGPFEYPPALALLQVSALPVLLWLAARGRWMPAGAGLAVAAAVIGLSASRVALAMAVAVVGWAALRRLAVPRAGALAGIAIVAVLAGSLAFGAEAGRGAGAPGGFLHGRDATWQAALDTFADRPLIGAGADAFLAGSARHQGGETILFAHDLPLELAAELGIAGLLLALALYAATALLIWRARSTEAGRLLGVAAAAFLLASLVDWPWHLAGAGAVWAVAVGGLAGAAAAEAKAA